MLSFTRPVLSLPVGTDTAYGDELTINTRELRATAVAGIKWRDISNDVQRIVAHSRIREGMMVAHTIHSTTALYLNENDGDYLVTTDIPRMLERFCPKGVSYAHDCEERLSALPNEPKNGHAHLQSILLGGIWPIPVRHHEIRLGPYQQIIFYDLDPENRPCRTIVTQVLGIR